MKKQAEAVCIQVQLILQTMITLASASLGLVAALAWNEAIKETMKQLFEGDDSLLAKYTYAILATVIAIVVVLWLAQLVSRIGGQTVISREAEG